MNLKLLSFALLASFVVISCGTDDEMKKEEKLTPSFRASLDWQDGIINYVTDFFGEASLDLLPSSMDITWTETPVRDPQTLDLQLPSSSTAFVFKDRNFGKTNVISAIAIDDTETTYIFFFVGGELEVGSYEYATLEMIETALSGDEFLLPPRTIAPTIGRRNSEAGELLSFLFFNEEIHYAGSTFDITKVDRETSEISGNFKIYASIFIEDEGNQGFLKVEDGNFVKVPIIE